MKILIVEDDFASRKFMMDYMSKYGECDDEPYDLICLDIMMPSMDGYQVLKAIRDIEKEDGVPSKEQAKIIMMTALSEEKNVKKAFEMGCSVYCAKPVDVNKLTSAMKKLGVL